MSRVEKFEELKKEVRSILLSYQKGCTVAELQRDYKSIIGRNLPVYEFSYRSETELLEDMPDVVRISYNYKGGNHLLLGIADENTMHIKKMVSCQKPSKPGRIYPLKALRPLKNFTYPKYTASHYLPPRLQQQNADSNLQFSRKVPTSFQFTKSTSQIPFEPKKTAAPSPALLPTPTNSAAAPEDVSKSNSLALQNASKSETSLQSTTSPRDEVISLVKHYRNGIPLSEILYEYGQMFGKELDLVTYGFNSVGECLESISELVLIDKGDGPYAVHESEVSRLIDETNSPVSSIETPGSKSAADDKTARPDSRNSSVSDSNVSSKLMCQLREVAKKYSKLIYSYEFPKCFEEITGSPLDLRRLGYNCLADFIDDVPDIFRRKPIGGVGNDYVIYPSNLVLTNDSHQDDDEPLVGALLVKEVVTNLRQILQANPEGILLDHIEYIYRINCKGNLCAADLGFSDLETFLNSIQEQVPLRIRVHNGIKKVYLVKFSGVNPESPSVGQEIYIPLDAAPANSQFKPLKLPQDFDFSKYVPVFVSNVISPGHFYVQFQEEKSTPSLGELSDMLDEFYYGEQSRLYCMKNAHIQVGACCIALWPFDQHWYRAQILSIPAVDKVQVNYLDYGTRDVIPTSLLRYIKKDFLKVPVFALRCCLTFLKPPRNAETWNEESKQKLLQMVKDVRLMAKMEDKKPDGTYCVVLCDTNGEDDVYINDALVDQNYAEYENIALNESKDVAAPTTMSTVDPVSSAPLMQPGSINPYQICQAHQYLLLFASALPSFSTNPHYLGLLQEVATLLSKANSSQATLKAPNPGLGFYPPGMGFPLGAMYSSTPLAGGSSSATNPLLLENGQVGLDTAGSSPIRAPTTGSAAAAAVSEVPVKDGKDEDGEIFEDDDVDFEKFCLEVVAKNKRYVKRVNFSDGYKLNIINHDSKAYVSCGDISQLIWINKEPDFLQKRLQVGEVDYSAFILYEDENVEMFNQLKRFHVKGLHKTESETSILLYPLKVVIRILNDFGHPSALLRTELTTEISNFDPDDSFWKEPSVFDMMEQAEESITDDDKIDKLDQLDRMCLYDLRAMKEGINQKRLQYLNHQGGSSIHVDTIKKLEQLQARVMQRMKEIQEICQTFS